MKFWDEVIGSTGETRSEFAVRSRVEERLSSSQIASMLGNTTANAVTGHLWRKEIKVPEMASVAKRAQVSRQDGAKRVATALKRPIPPKFNPEPDIVDNTAADDLANPSPDRKTLQTLTDSCCRWPVGDPLTPEFHFCGRGRVPDTPYCQLHLRRAFRVPDPQYAKYGKVPQSTENAKTLETI